MCVSASTTVVCVSVNGVFVCTYTHRVLTSAVAFSCAQARERLVAVQKSLAAAESQSREALALSEETEELEAAVCRAAQRVAALHEALNGDEAALSARLAAQASRLKVRGNADGFVPCNSIGYRVLLFLCWWWWRVLVVMAALCLHCSGETHV